MSSGNIAFISLALNFISNFRRTSHSVKCFSEGRGAFQVGSNSVAVFITLNNSLYDSRLNSLWRNQWGISDSKNPIFDGSFYTAYCMHRASE